MGKEESSPVIEYACQVLSDGIRRLKNNECSEAQVAYMVARMNAEGSGYHNDNTYVNSDEVIRILHTRNRVKARQLLKAHGIKLHKINNMPVGYLRSEVEDLANRLGKPNEPKFVR